MSVTYIIRITCDGCGMAVCEYSPFGGRTATQYRLALLNHKWISTKDFGTSEIKDWCPTCRESSKDKGG